MKKDNFHIHTNLIQSKEFQLNSITNNLNFDASDASAGCNLIFGVGQHIRTGYFTKIDNVNNSDIDNSDIDNKNHFVLCSNKITDFTNKKSKVYSDLIEYANKFNYKITFEKVFSVIENLAIENSAIETSEMNGTINSENYNSTKLIN